nr:MAG: hypothetical protein [Bacteriophage sp.]
MFLKPFITSFLAIDTSKIFGYFVMQDINKKEGVSHPFFLKICWVCLSKVCQLARVEKVSKPLKIYIHFLFLVMTDNDWQEESNPLSNHSSLDIVKSLSGIFPFRF